MIFDFKNYNDWMCEFNSIFKNYDCSSIINKFKHNTDAIEISDITETIGTEIIDSVKNLLTNKYKYVVFYHGTATDDISSYFTKGLLPLNVEERNIYARKLFNQNEYPEITDEKFIKATKKQFKNDNSLKLRQNRLYFTLDNDVFKESYSSHYLIYGGEHLVHLAQNLGSSYPKELSKKLNPLILKCRVPIHLISDYIDNITKEIIIRYLENLIYPEYKFPILDVGIYITTKLESDDIIGCEFPKDIKKTSLC